MLRKLYPIVALIVFTLIVIGSLEELNGAWNHLLAANGMVRLGDVNAQISSLTVLAGSNNSGICAKSITDSFNSTFTIERAIPGFTCKINWTVKNIGSIPWKVSEPKYQFDSNSDAIDVIKNESSFPKKCTLVKPGDIISGNFTIKVLAAADANSNYTGSLSFVIQNFMDTCNPY